MHLNENKLHASIEHFEEINLRENKVNASRTYPHRDQPNFTFSNVGTDIRPIVSVDCVWSASEAYEKPGRGGRKRQISAKVDSLQRSGGDRQPKLIFSNDYKKL